MKLQQEIRHYCPDTIFLYDNLRMYSLSDPSRMECQYMLSKYCIYSTMKYYLLYVCVILRNRIHLNNIFKVPSVRDPSILNDPLDCLGISLCIISLYISLWWVSSLPSVKKDSANFFYSSYIRP